MLSPICEKTSVLVGGSGGASYDLGSISGWQARMPTAIRPTYSTPDPLRLRPVKRATKRPIDRGQCNWWSSTACGQDPAIVANFAAASSGGGVLVLGWISHSRVAARWSNPLSPSWRYPAEMVGHPHLLFMIAKPFTCLSSTKHH